jgi:hypothetical protein
MTFYERGNQEMGKVHWSKLELADGEGCDISGSERIKALDKFKTTGEMAGAVFCQTGSEHENPRDATTWGPKDADGVDWSGFPVETE